MSAGSRVRGLYAVTPDLDDTAALERKVDLALRGGAKLVQYRNKTAPHALRLEQARALKDVCAAHGAAFIVNDHLDIALEVDADGVHLGREDGDAREARAKLGPAKLLGISCYQSVERAREAVRTGADHVAFGSFFPSRVKPGAARATVDLLIEAKRELTVPVVAIGGITADNAGSLVEHGADALAVITAVFDAPDIERAAAAFTPLFQSRR